MFLKTIFLSHYEYLTLSDYLTYVIPYSTDCSGLNGCVVGPASNEYYDVL